jgi:hypothetical protein
MGPVRRPSTPGLFAVPIILHSYRPIVSASANPFALIKLRAEQTRRGRGRDLRSGVLSGSTRRVWVVAAALLQSPCPRSKALAYGASESHSLDPAWSYSSVTDGEKHVPGALESSQLSGYCGLCSQPSGERPVAIDPSRTISFRLRPRFLGIGLHHCAKRLRCLSLARKNLIPKRGE